MGKRANNEGSIYQRSRDGLWVAAVLLPSGQRKVFYGKTQAEALAKKNQALKNIADGLSVSPERITLAQYLERWLKDSVKPSVRPYTFDSYSALVRCHIAPELGRIHIGKLTPQDVQGFLNRKLASGLSPRTVQYLHSVLRRALWQAERWAMVPRNVARLVSPPRVPRANVQPLTPADAKRLLAAVSGDRLEALYTVALAVGLRQAEALGLRWQDVNLEAGTLTVAGSLQRIAGVFQLAEPKTERSHRTVKLPDVCVDALRRHKERQDAERAWFGTGWQDRWGLLFTQEDGSPLHRDAVTRRFQAVLAQAGIARHRFHDLRHTCATLLLVQGVQLRVVMELLGHSQMATTADIYSHVLPVLMADAAERMNTVLAMP